MISIIICSKKPEIAAALRQNIIDTVGCDHEIVVIDNSEGRYNISEAYNEGVSRAKGNILCFMHDDVMYHTQGWGEEVERLFEDDTIGMIGVAGTHFLANAPMYWVLSPYVSSYNIDNNKGKKRENFATDYFNEGIADVVAVDGQCFFIPKKLFSDIRFDDINYKGFHGYDMDISMQVLALEKRVCVTQKLLVEHFWSDWKFHDRYTFDALNKSMNVFRLKWGKQLPIVKGIQLTPTVVARLNDLCSLACDIDSTRNSKAYRLGRFLLHPMSVFKRSKISKKRR